MTGKPYQNNRRKPIKTDRYETAIPKNIDDGTYDACRHTVCQRRESSGSGISQKTEVLFVEIYWNAHGIVFSVSLGF